MLHALAASTLFPYTTLFRSDAVAVRWAASPGRSAFALGLALVCGRLSVAPQLDSTLRAGAVIRDDADRPATPVLYPSRRLRLDSPGDSAVRVLFVVSRPAFDVLGNDARRFAARRRP